MSTRPRLLNSDAFAHQPLWCRCVPPEHTCSLICRRKPMCTHLTGTCLHTHLYVQHTCIHTSVHMHTHARYSPPSPRTWCTHTFIYVALYTSHMPIRAHKHRCAHTHERMSALTHAHTYTAHRCMHLKHVHKERHAHTGTAPLGLQMNRNVPRLGCLSSGMATGPFSGGVRAVFFLWFLCCTLSALDILSVQRFEPLLLDPVLG